MANSKQQKQESALAKFWREASDGTAYKITKWLADLGGGLEMHEAMFKTAQNKKQEQRYGKEEGL